MREDSYKANGKSSFYVLNYQIISSVARRKKFLALKTGQGENSGLMSCGQKRRPMKRHGKIFCGRSYRKFKGKEANSFPSGNVAR
jgi:hypothetical protein